MRVPGEVASHLAFARDNPQRAIVQIPIDGAPHAHSWDLSTGHVVTATDGDALRPTITPDGLWLWWFDGGEHTWWRRPFGSSPRGHRNRPLQLRPTPDVELALGGDGTAIVGRPVPGMGQVFSLLPVGRLRPGAEPTFLGSFTQVRAFFRSRDDSLLAVDTGTAVHVCSAYTGQELSEAPLGAGWRVAGFAHADSVLLTEYSAGVEAEAPEEVVAARLWNPHTHLHRTISLDGVAHPTRLTLNYQGDGLLVESWRGAANEDGHAKDRFAVYMVNFDGTRATLVGPTQGTIIPGSAVGGPAGEVYATWRDDDAPARLTDLTLSEARGESSAAHHVYRPAVGGYSH